jgi:integrase
MSFEIAALTGEELQRLYALNGDARQSALVKLAIDTACRSAELSQLTWEDIDFERGTVTVSGDFPRQLPLQKTTLKALKAWHTEASPRRHGPLFCTIRGRCRPLAQRNLDMVFTAAGRKAGIASLVSARAVRRSVCVHKMQSGMSAEDLQRFMGVKDRSSLTHYYQKTYDCGPNEGHPAHSHPTQSQPLPTHGGTWLALALLAVGGLALQFAWRYFRHRQKPR